MLFFFFLLDDCFTVLYWSLPHSSMSQPQVHLCPVPPESASHLPPHPTPLVVTECGLERPVSRRAFPLAVYFAYGEVHFPCYSLNLSYPLLPLGFPCGSAGEESACNAGDLGSIPGLGRSPGEGKGYPLQYSGLEKAWRIPREFHGLCSPWGSQRVGHDLATFTFTVSPSSTVSTSLFSMPASPLLSCKRFTSTIFLDSTCVH